MSWFYSCGFWRLKDKRFGAYDSITGILRTIIEADILSAKAQIQMVVSKYDVVATRLSDTDIEDYITSLANGLQEYLQMQIQGYNVAAMPTQEEPYEFGYGIKELFLTWCGKRNSIMESSIYNNTRVTSSEYNKLYQKILGDKDE